MTGEARSRELLAGFHLQTLHEGEQREFRQMIEADPRLARTVGDDLLIDRLLVHAFDDGMNSDEFARAVRMRIQAGTRKGDAPRTYLRGGLAMAAAILLIGMIFWSILTPAPPGRLPPDPAQEKLSEEKEWDARVQALPKIAPLRVAKRGVEVTLKTSLRGEELILEDDASMMLNGQLKHLVTVKTVCAADHTLSLRGFSYEMTDPTTGNKSSYTGVVKDGKLVVKGDRPLEQDVSLKTIGNLTFYRLLWTLPQRAGFTLDFDVFDERLDFRPGQKLTCKGEEEIEIAGKKVKAWKWEFARRVPSLKELYAVENYWVAGGKVVKAESDTRPGKHMYQPEE